MEDLELLQGTVAAVVYQNAENGYAVLRLSCGGQAVSVVGTIPLPVPGERLVITGPSQPYYHSPSRREQQKYPFPFHIPQAARMNVKA